MHKLKAMVMGLFAALLAAGIAFADPLHDAAASGDTAKVKKLLKKKADANARNVNGFTPLHYAASFGFNEIAVLLLEHGADIHAMDNWGFTPLHRAALEGKTEAARLLVDRGADIHTRNNDGNMPLHFAAYKGNAGIAGLLIDRGADVNARNNYGAAPLHLTAEQDSTDAAKLLMDRGADVNAANNEGFTTLHFAALSGMPDAAAVLIDRGADIHARANNGETALNMAYQGFIGLKIKSADNIITVDAVVKDSPAERAGLQAGDRITMIGAETANGMAVQDAVLRLRGKAGTPVTILVLKTGSNQQVSHTITRAVLKQKEAVARLIETRIAHDLEAARALGTEAAYRDFISRNPDSIHRTEAVKALAGIYLARPDADKALEGATSEFPEMIVFLPPDKRLRFIGPPDMQVYKILEHLRKGTGEKLIITKIRSEKSGYKNFTLDEISKLKEMGLTEPVIDEMIAATARAEAASENAALREEIAQLRKTIEAMQARQAQTQVTIQTSGQPVQASAPQQPGVGEAIANCASQLAALELCNQAPGGFIGQEICKAAAKSQFPCNR